MPNKIKINFFSMEKLNLSEQEQIRIVCLNYEWKQRGQKNKGMEEKQMIMQERQEEFNRCWKQNQYVFVFAYDGLCRHSNNQNLNYFYFQLFVMGGNSPSIQYATPISEKPQGSTPVFRHPSFKNGLLEAPQPNLKTMKHVVKDSFKKYANSNCLGRIVRPKQEKEYIQYKTYQQVFNESVTLGSAIIHEKLFHQPEGQNLKFIAIFSRNRPEWTIVDIACVLYNCVTIPIYDTLGDENISYVFNHTNLTTCFVNDLGIKALMKTHDMGSVKTIVSFDPFTDDQFKYFAEKNINLRSYSDLLKIGEQNKVDFNTEEYNVEPNDCITFSYTSGTTGPPKGAMLSHRNFTSFLASLDKNEHARMNSTDVILSYLPLPHILERQLLYVLMYVGGTIVSFSGDTQKIKEDLALVKPTIFVSVPRLFSRFYDAIQKKFEEITGYTKSALNYGLSKKMNNVSTNGGYTHKIYDRVFFNKTKAALGGRVRLMVSGSAPLLPDVHKFLKVVLSAPLLEAYGQTESTGGSFVTHANDPQVGQIGGPIASIEYKLVDLPEMNYTSKDVDENGNPRPRGQIWMRGPGVFLGYYKNDEKTKEALTEDGWLKSGDVGAILPKTKALKIIDRKKNIFKLQQGEYVAAEKVENVYMKYQNLAEIFLHGESTQSFAVAIATFQKKKVEEIAKQKGIQGSYEEICQHPTIRGYFLAEINNVGKIGGLKSFEQAKNLYIEPHGFMLKGILTNTMKIQRHEAKLTYVEEIKSLYDEGMLPTDKEKKKE